MQEEVESRTVMLILRTSKLTGDVLKSALEKYLAYRRDKNRAEAFVKPEGKQTVKELVGQNQGVSSIEITEKNIRGFERVARKYGVDYAVKKDSSGDIPKYLVFFKAKDADALTAAFVEYSRKKEKKSEKPSVVKHIRELKQTEAVKDKTRVRNMEKGLEL